MRDLHGSGRRRRREDGDDDVEAIGETLISFPSLLAGEEASQKGNGDKVRILL
jgi:hypothetical protein